MIDVKELKYGNYVQLPLGEIIPIHGIYPQAVGTTKGTMMLTDISPIPLTPEILEKCGFVDGKLPVGHLMFTWYGENNMGIHGMLGTIKPLSINYLHQLQNIIYTTTQTELKIEL